MYTKTSTGAHKDPPQPASSNSPQGSQSGSASSAAVARRSTSASQALYAQPFSTFSILFPDHGAHDLAPPVPEASGSPQVPQMPSLRAPTIRSPPQDAHQSSNPGIPPAPSTSQSKMQYPNHTAASQFSPASQTGAAAMPGNEQK